MLGEWQLQIENPRFSPDGRNIVSAVTPKTDEPPDLYRHDTVMILNWSAGR